MIPTQKRYFYFLFITISLIFVPPLQAQIDIPDNLLEITAENASQLELLDTVGYGWLQEFQWTPDGENLAIVASNGVLIYEIDNWTQVAFIPAQSPPILAIEFNPQGTLFGLLEKDLVRVFDWETLSENFSINETTFDGYGYYIFGLSESYFEFHSRQRSELVFYNLANGEIYGSFGDGNYDFGVSIDYVPYSNQISTDALIEEKNNSGIFDYEPSEQKYADWQTTFDDLVTEEVSWIEFNEEIGVQNYCLRNLNNSYGCDKNALVFWNLNTGEVINQFFLSLLSGAVSYTYKRTLIISALQPDGLQYAFPYCVVNHPICYAWEIHILDTVTGNMRHQTNLGFSNPPINLDYSLDGEYLAAGDGTILRIFDAETYEIVTSFTGFHGPISDLNFSPDGVLLAASSGGYAEVTNFWSLETEAKQPTLIPCGGRGAFHPQDNYTFACAGFGAERAINYESQLEIWDITSDAQTERIHINSEPDYYYDVDFHPDGQWLLASTRNELYLFEATDYQIEKYLDSRLYFARVNFLTSNRFYYGSGMDEGIYEFNNVFDYDRDVGWDLEQLISIGNENSTISNNGRWIANWNINESDEQIIELYNLIDDTSQFMVVNEFLKPSEFIIIENQEMMILRNWDQNDKQWLYIIDILTGNILQKLDEFGDNLTALTLSPDGKLLVVSTGFFDPRISSRTDSNSHIYIFGVPASE